MYLLCVKHAHTVIVVVQSVEHEPESFLVSLEVLRELLEIQQTIMVGVALKDYL